ncbi:MAG: type II secretion system GspH family protein [Meiothermus sp.]|uniref:PilW family protein n=1 Tax=Meiothermus sp. TaxID=1955249 RepID=UPI00260FDAD5|nr:prepilin-type N-terminal cleavage/methylation domain-containing protein [Meiothermus sp.]MCS7059507.1 type II secretion system GspH family protein [Meiothermus sp.]
MRQGGLTLVELLVAMAVFGVVVALASDLIVRNQNLSNRQVLAGRVQEDVRLATLRLGDVVAQAAYIYPNGVTLTLPGGRSLTTGGEALAVLLPPGTAYCPLSGGYCGFAYRLEGRGPHAASLDPAPGNSGVVLVEYQVRGVTWNPNTNPAQTARDWSGLALHSEGVVADSIERTGTDLGTLYFAGIESTIDRVLLIPSLQPDLTTSDPRALIGAVRVRVAVRYANGVWASRQAEVYARGIPRSLPPGM